MERGKIIVAGIGPGSEADMTQAVREALAEADVVVGYKYYFGFVRPFVKESAECVDTGMRRERERAEVALERAEAGQVVCVVSSGDAGIYGMASLVWEVKRERHSPVEVIVLPGISAFQKAAALLGAPVGHDFCVLSLSDLLTPWEVIERRIRAAAEADFVTAVYNPRSEGRYWQLHRLREIFLEARDGATPVGYVKQAGRSGEEVTVTTLAAFDPEQVDMFTVVLIGNSESYTWEGKIITPRGYFTEREEGRKVGQEIMSRSFQRIMSELRYPERFEGESREVYLTGEGYFEVTKDAKRPFRVKLGDVTVEVLGTEFNAKGYAGEETLDVTLVSGGVRVLEEEREVARLKPSERVDVNVRTGDFRVSKADLGSVLAWKEGMFVFKNTPLEMILRQLSRWYGVEFSLDEGLAEGVYSGNISRFEPLERVLDIMRLTNEIEFVEVEKNKIEVIPKE